MDTWTTIQRRILAVLEEAGEDTISALTNTVEKRRGVSSEVEEMCAGLSGLLSSDYIEIGRHSDGGTRRWLPLPENGALALIDNLPQFLQWSVPEQLWTWCQDHSRAEVVLTKIGMIAARRVLTEDGWPL